MQNLFGLITLKYKR